MTSTLNANNTPAHSLQTLYRSIHHLTVPNRIDSHITAALPTHPSDRLLRPTQASAYTSRSCSTFYN